MARNINDYGLTSANYKTFNNMTHGGTAYGTTIVSGGGKFLGIMVCTASSGLGSTGSPWITLYDATQNTGGTQSLGSTIYNTFTSVAGTFYHLGAPIQFENGLYVYSGGSLKCTISYY
jgi:hypothetical protein